MSEVFHDYITGEEVTRPRRKVIAYTGAFALDWMGDYDSVHAAVKVARKGGYPFVAVVFRDGSSATIEITRP